MPSFYGESFVMKHFILEISRNTQFKPSKNYLFKQTIMNLSLHLFIPE